MLWGALFAARMMLLMHALVSFARNVSVNLRGRDVTMSEEHLDYTQVSAGVEQMRSKSVPQGVGR